MDSPISQSSSPRCRKSKGATYYRALFEEQSRRGISMEQLAAERGIPYTTLTHWRYRFRQQDSDARGKEASTKLVLAKIKASPQSPAPINLHTPFGHTLHIPTGFCVETFGRRVKTVVGAVETEMLYHGWHMIGTFEKKVSGNEWLWQEVPMSRGEGMIEHVALDTNTSAVVVPVSGLYDFRNRWYSPESGSWLSRDPLGQVDSENLYQFARAASILRQDTFGLASRPGYTGYPAGGGGWVWDGIPFSQEGCHCPCGGKDAQSWQDLKVELNDACQNVTSFTGGDKGMDGMVPRFCKAWKDDRIKFDGCNGRCGKGECAKTTPSGNVNDSSFVITIQFCCTSTANATYPSGCEGGSCSALMEHEIAHAFSMHSYGNAYNQNWHYKNRTPAHSKSGRAVIDCMKNGNQRNSKECKAAEAFIKTSDNR